MIQRVGMIGIGLMGRGIARNVLKHGYALSLLDHPGNQPIDDLLAAGAHVRKTPAEVAADSEALILCVTGAPQVEAVLTGEDGAAKSLSSGTVVIDCSTSLPETSLSMAAVAEAVGAKFLDAAMTKLPQHAEAGTLNLLVGGDAPVLERVRPLLAAFSESIIHVGPVGAGHRMKLLHNYVSLGSMALLCEVAAHARHAGFEMSTLIDVLAAGGGAGVALQRVSPFLLQGDSSNVPFFLSNALKDLTYYCQTASEAHAACGIAAAVRSTLEAAVSAGHGQAFFPELAEILSPSRS